MLANYEFIIIGEPPPLASPGLIGFAMRIMRALAVAALTLLTPVLPARAAEPAVLALLVPFSFADTSAEPRDQKAEHAARLARMADDLKAKLGASGLYRIALAPPEASRCPAGDSDCILATVRRAGADLVLTGAIQKISTMATNCWAAVFDAASGKRLFYRQLTFRGDTDEAWQRATDFLVHEIESDPPKKP
jgi:Protein of unknown function (DUF2380)